MQHILNHKALPFHGRVVSTVSPNLHVFTKYLCLLRDLNYKNFFVLQIHTHTDKKLNIKTEEKA